MECKTCLLTDDIVKIEEDGNCEFCHLHSKLEKEHTDIEPLLQKIKKAGKGKKYDCLIGISGGFDSNTLLHRAVTRYGLKPFVMHFDNGWNTPESEHNMQAITKALGVELHRVVLNTPQQQQYDRLCKAVLFSGMPDGDIPNDMVAFDLMYTMALKNGIKYILNGHNFRTEGSTPVKFTYMDARYLKSIYNHFYQDKLTLKIFTFSRQLYFALRGIRQVRPLYYDSSSPEMVKDFLIEKYKLQDYGDKHAENVFTHFIGNYLLPIKFNIDKRIIYLSAMVRSGYTTKAHAKEKMRKEVRFPMEKFWEIEDFVDINKVMSAPIRERSYFRSYNFKKLKWIIWIMVKLQVVPYNFYKKYCI
jgi:hypothetical protein